MDTDNDGRITRQEWRGSAESFRVHDWNRDGVLSGTELRPGMQRNRRFDDQDFDPRADDFGWSQEGFTALDHNRDGRLTQNEWHYDHQSFWRADSNRDGALSRSEFIGSGIEDDRDDRFEYLDTNNDGRIERNEWHGSTTVFQWLDRDDNGVLSRAETVGTTPTDATDQFASLDFDHDGVISRNEWHWSPRSFDSRDRNRDGRLSRTEYRSPADTTTDSPVADRVVNVNSTVRWTDTGLDIRAGNLIRFHADGRVQLSDNPSDIATPQGAQSGRRAPNAPLTEAPAGGLIVRIGNSAPIYVGANGTISRAPASGRLYLGVNDDHLPDNSGEYRVTVDIER